MAAAVAWSGSAQLRCSSGASASSPPCCSCSMLKLPVSGAGKALTSGDGHRLNSHFLGGVAPLRSSNSRSGTRSVSRFPLQARAALVQKVTAKELDDILTNDRKVPMIIDFYATWCGPCIVLAQQLEELAIEYEDVKFLKVDTDEEYELASQMAIRGLPTMVFVSPDTEKLAIRTEGLLPMNTIRNIIENEL